MGWIVQREEIKLIKNYLLFFVCNLHDSELCCEWSSMFSLDSRRHKIHFARVNVKPHRIRHREGVFGIWAIPGISTSQIIVWQVVFGQVAVNRNNINRESRRYGICMFCWFTLLKTRLEGISLVNILINWPRIGPVVDNFELSIIFRRQIYLFVEFIKNLSELFTTLFITWHYHELLVRLQIWQVKPAN